jgi:hypothetical protein
MDSQQIYAAVSERYSELSSDAAQARSGRSKSVAQAFGYTQEELDSIPEQSNLGLSCGNPLAIASLREVRPGVTCGYAAFPNRRQG